jgi:hypothetical protein
MLYRLVDEAASSHEPTIIQGKGGITILISEDACRAVNKGNNPSPEYSPYEGINSERFSHFGQGMHPGT